MSTEGKVRRRNTLHLRNGRDGACGKVSPMHVTDDPDRVTCGHCLRRLAGAPPEPEFWPFPLARDGYALMPLTGAVPAEYMDPDGIGHTWHKLFDVLAEGLDEVSSVEVREASLHPDEVFVHLVDVISVRGYAVQDRRAVFAWLCAQWLGRVEMRSGAVYGS